MCVFFLLSSPSRLSFVSVVFDFNASLNNVAPVFPMLFPVYVMRKLCFVDGFLLCVFFLLSSPHRSSAVSVVFDFNVSLIDFAPVFPILLPVDVMRNERVNC